MEGGSPKMTLAPRETTVSSSPAVAANAEGEEIEVLETTDVYPAAPEEVSHKTPPHWPRHAESIQLHIHPRVKMMPENTRLQRALHAALAADGELFTDPVITHSVVFYYAP